jgi:glycosyltransferase involved in cell wall biosynthesis
MAYRLAAMEAASLVTVSKDLQQFLCQTTGIPADSVRVICNGIDLVPGMQSKRNRDRLGAIGIPPDAHVVGAVGNLYAVKGHIHLVRALRQIVQQRPNVHVVILGRGEEQEALRAEATALGIADHFHLLGYCNDVQGWLNTMDVYAMPSLSEGLPLSLLEAMASTIPVVVTKVGGIPEVISDGETGFLVAVGDIDALARRIMLLLDQPSLAERIAKAGRSLVQRRFSLEAMAGAYSALYQEAVARGGKAHASGMAR